MDYVDNYCERIGPGLWGEPVNALTNGAFLIAGALMVWLLLRQHRAVPVHVWLLPVTTIVVGLCSLAFHTFATPFTGALDSLSIVVFILLAVVITVHQSWDVPWRLAWLGAPAFLLLMIGLTAVLSAVGIPTVMGSYLSAVVGLVGFGLAIRFTGQPEVRRIGVLLLCTAAVFAVSLTLRTLDGPLCAHIPLGTHFLWHCLNATVLFLVSYAVLRSWQARNFAHVVD